MMTSPQMIQACLREVNIKYDFNVNIKNIPCHLDMERDLKTQANGLFTITLRVNQGEIKDYVNYYTPTTAEYNPIFNAAEPKCEITRSSGDDSPKG